MLRNRVLTLCVLTMLLAAVASAGPFTSLVVYGDSLSDNRNLFAATRSLGAPYPGVPYPGPPYPGPPYYAGRFSNGPVAAEDLAALLGVPLIDYAWGGATTGIGNEGDGGTPTSLGALGLPGMTTVYNATKGSLGAFLPDALFMVWGGPNDFASPSPLDTTPTEIADRAVADLLGIVAGLQGLGARNILVPGLPDLGLTPLARSLGPAAAAQASVLTDYFNGRLTAALPSGVTYVDTADLLRDIVTNPGSYGFTNVTDACYSFATSSLCANPDQYLFFDASHPTARAHAILAEEFAEAVPEPATWRFVLSGIVLLTVGRLVTRRPR